MAGILYSLGKMCASELCIVPHSKKKSLSVWPPMVSPSLEEEENGTEEPGRWSIAKALRQDLNL